MGCPIERSETLPALPALPPVRSETLATPAFFPVAANLPSGQRFAAADFKHNPPLATHRNYTRPTDPTGAKNNPTGAKNNPVGT
jgi:hypothetical protein